MDHTRKLHLEVPENVCCKLENFEELLQNPLVSSILEWTFSYDATSVQDDTPYCTEFFESILVQVEKNFEKMDLRDFGCIYWKNITVYLVERRLIDWYPYQTGLDCE